MPIARPMCLACALLLLSAMPTIAQGVEGTWIFSVASPDGVVQMEVDFERDGDEIKGDVRQDVVESVEIVEGRMEGNVLTFVLRVGFQGEWFALDISATVEGDAMTGQATLAEMGSMPFTAKRAAGT